MSKIICYYRRNLKMSAGKLAAQVGHVTSRLSVGREPPTWVVVLMCSDKKFEQYKNQYPEAYIHKDLGCTEVEPGTETVIGWWENES